MKVLTILGGIVGLFTVILSLTPYSGYTYAFISPLTGLDIVINVIVGIIVSIITIWAGLKPLGNVNNLSSFINSLWCRYLGVCIGYYCCFNRDY